MSSHLVTIFRVEPRWIAAAKAPAKPGEISSTMLALLGRGWNFIKQSGVKSDGQNVAIYRQDFIEAGPRVIEKFEDSGGIACVASPSGLAAMTIHMGPYQQLGEAHAAVRDWCVANGHALEGTNWEVYGHHEDDPARRRTDVFYLLRS
jgi:effector-binding domain-containing protein